MSMIEDILGTMQSWGLGSDAQGGLDWGGLADITGGDVSSRMAEMYGIDQPDIPAHLFQGISADMLKSGLASTYSPIVEKTGQTLLGDLSKTLGGASAAKATGGFAGSGQQQRYTTQAKDLYGKGMSDVISDTAQSRLKGQQNVRDIIDSWSKTAQRIKYGG